MRFVGFKVIFLVGDFIEIELVVVFRRRVVFSFFKNFGVFILGEYKVYE